MLYYAILGVGLALLILGWAVRSPVVRAMVRGHTTDPAQWGSWQDHLDDQGLGVSWRSDGWGGTRETKVQSKHTRRR
jgi:hypothetical protein